MQKLHGNFSVFTVYICYNQHQWKRDQATITHQGAAKTVTHLRKILLKTKVFKGIFTETLDKLKSQEETQPV